MDYRISRKVFRLLKEIEDFIGSDEGVYENDSEETLMEAISDISVSLQSLISDKIREKNEA